MNPSVHQSAAAPATLAHIETAARMLRNQRDQVASLVTELNDKISALQADYTRRLKTSVAKTAALHSQLSNLIDSNRQLFIKPRTVTFHGINCGIEKGKGKIEFDDETAVIANIEKKLPDQSDVLIKTEKTLLKTPLKNLTGAELKSLGCTVEETGDRVIVRFADKEVDKLVNALLKNAVEESIQAEAA